MKDETVAQLIQSNWEKVEARITLEDTMTSFINQNLDQCGATICFSAFQLVSQVLDKGGFVRRINKSEYSNLSSVLTNPEGPWVEQDKPVDRHWDYSGTWLNNIDKIGLNAHKSEVEWQKYYPVDKDEVFKRFCEPIQNNDPQNTVLGRSKRANFQLHDTVSKTSSEQEDPNYAWSPLQTPTVKNKVHHSNKNRTRNLFSAPYDECIKAHGNAKKAIQRWETKSVDNYSMEPCLTSAIEPYWMFDLRDKKDWGELQLKKYKINEKDMSITSIQRPDLVMEVTYTCPKLYFQKKRVVFVEIDGDEKTYQTKRTDENMTQTEIFNINPAKLALKMMQSTSVQSVLQPHTYNIRSNFYSYLKETVDQSLLNTTNFEIPSLKDILNRLTSSNLRDSGLNDFHQLTRMIHILWHMFRAHVKVAYLIYMREVYDIDIRDGFGENNIDKVTNENMKDHHFFINFTGACIPTTLNFTDKISIKIKKYLEEKLMLQSIVKIKVFDNTEPKQKGVPPESKWIAAPIMSTGNSNMEDWSARVISGQIPTLPNESNTSIPVSYATLQRVDIKKLCETIKVAAAESFNRYCNSRIISLKDDELKRRDFPDRCYLTRREQLDRDKWWNRQLGAPSTSNKVLPGEICRENELRPPGIGLRCYSETLEDDQIELNFGYETPKKIRDYHIFPSDIGECTWDQVDIRMHYFYNEMNKREWKKYSNGIWYTEDYISFFRMLQSLQGPTSAQIFQGDKCEFTKNPDPNKGKNHTENLKLAVESTKYRLRLHNFKTRKVTILKDVHLIDHFWQSTNNSKFEQHIELKTFISMLNLLKQKIDDISVAKNRELIEDQIVTYIIKNKILIPIRTAKTNNVSKENPKKCTFHFAELSNTSSLRHGERTFKVKYIGYENDPVPSEFFTLLQILQTFTIYHNIRKLNVLDQTVDSFFGKIIDDFKNLTSDDSEPADFEIGNYTTIKNILVSTTIKIKWAIKNPMNSYTLKMPEQSPQQDLAYHIYSVLCFFFNCRDDGACRYRWEEWLLEYFGASCTGDQQSDFHQFDFQSSTSSPDYKYYNQTWFQMCFFMEHNFRNAISAINYKLFDMNSTAGYFPDVGKQIGLQTVARNVYHREKSLLNNRSSFAGLGNVSTGLSFRKYNARTQTNLPLRDRIMSQLHDELPDLDPTLARYVQKFRIPDSELFLRIIRCPNILALRELARQHLSPEPQKHMREVLQFFDPAVQSEIEVMLKFVQTDESVYVTSPEEHPSKRLILTETQMLKWMREIVKCSSFATSLGMLSNVTPLQCKYDMFLKPKTLHIIKNLFCSRNLLNFASQRPLKFILLQLALVNKILMSEDVCDCEHANDNLYLALDKTEVDTCAPIFLKFKLRIHSAEKFIPCVINSSRRGWPRRDLNKISDLKKSKNPQDNDNDKNNQGIYEEIISLFEKNGITVEKETSNQQKILLCHRGEKDITGDIHDEMTDEELRKWMLLSYARPCSTVESEPNVRITQEKFVRNSSAGGDCENIELHYEEEIIENKRVLSCYIHRVEEDLYFERYERSYQSDKENEFPVYIQALIPKSIDRKLIYIPKECASLFLKKKWPDFFTHEVDGLVYKWRPLYAGLRTWCWKRLMIKMIFIHSFGKILTTTKTLLSMYTDNDNLKYTEIMNIMKETNKNTQDTFGDLGCNQNWLPKDCRERKHMKLHTNQPVMMTLHSYKCRKYVGVAGQIEYNTLECCKSTAIQKQLKWILYTKTHETKIKPMMSCRYLRIDRRLEDKEIVKDAHALNFDEDHYVYRDCLYFESEKSYQIINVNNDYFIKFPCSFVIRARKNSISGDDVDTFVLETKHDFLRTEYFMTVFNTRRCNWFKSIQLDSKEDTIYLEDYKNISLNLNPNGKKIRTVSDVFHNGLQWAFNTSNDFTTQVEKITTAYSLSSLKESSTLFTLPDFYLEKITQASINTIFQHSSIKDTENADFHDLQNCKWWITFRGKSNFLRYDQKTLVEEQNRVFKDDCLATIMTDVKRTLRPSASESMPN